jgi:hypothetical protein
VEAEGGVGGGRGAAVVPDGGLVAVPHNRGRVRVSVVGFVIGEVRRVRRGGGGPATGGRAAGCQTRDDFPTGSRVRVTH